MLVVAELSNIAINDFDVKETVRCWRLHVVTELVVSGAQCTVKIFKKFLHVIKNDLFYVINKGSSLLTLQEEYPILPGS